MNHASIWRALPGAAAASLLATTVAGSIAAPTTSLDDAEVPARNSGAPVARPLSPTMPGIRPAERAETPTGNKNLDLLLELQGRPGEEPRQVAPRSAAAASAAAAALADLRSKAAERPAPARPAADPSTARPLGLPIEGVGTPDLVGRSAPPQVERREWSSQLRGSAGSTDNPRDPYRTGDRESDAMRGGYSDDNLLRRLPREVIIFVRENRYWLLGALGVVAVLGAAIKSFSRRI